MHDSPFTNHLAAAIVLKMFKSLGWRVNVEQRVPNYLYTLTNNVKMYKKRGVLLLISTFNYLRITYVFWKTSITEIVPPESQGCVFIMDLAFDRNS